MMSKKLYGIGLAVLSMMVASPSFSSDNDFNFDPEEFERKFKEAEEKLKKKEDLDLSKIILESKEEDNEDLEFQKILFESLKDEKSVDNFEYNEKEFEENFKKQEEILKEQERLQLEHYKRIRDEKKQTQNTGPLRMFGFEQENQMIENAKKKSLQETNIYQTLEKKNIFETLGKFGNKKN